MSLFGLQNFNSSCPEAVAFLSCLAAKLEELLLSGFKIEMRPEEIASALYGLQSMVDALKATLKYRHITAKSF